MKSLHIVCPTRRMRNHVGKGIDCLLLRAREAVATLCPRQELAPLAAQTQALAPLARCLGACSRTLPLFVQPKLAPPSSGRDLVPIGAVPPACLGILHGGPPGDELLPSCLEDLLHALPVPGDLEAHPGRRLAGHRRAERLIVVVTVEHARRGSPL